MSEKIQSWSLDQKKLKKRGERSKYVRELWPCDDWIKNDKKGRWSNYVGEHQSNEDRQEWLKIREGAKHLFEKIDKTMIKKEGGGQIMLRNTRLITLIFW